MKFHRAKFLDRWIGMPACYFLSLFDGIRKVFLSRGSIESPGFDKILIVGLSEIGSNLLAYSAIEKIRSTYPVARLCFLVFEENKEALALLGNVESENILTIRNTSLRGLFDDTLKFVRWATREKIDVAVDLELFSCFSSLLSYLSGAKIRVGFFGYFIKGVYRGALLTHKVKFNEHCHISENFMALAEAINANPTDRPLLKKRLCEGKELPLLKAESSAIETVRGKLGRGNPRGAVFERIVIINPEADTRLPLRKWPGEHYYALTGKLLLIPNVLVVAVGIGRGRFFPECKEDRYIDLIGKTTGKELVALLSMARVLVSHDSGLVHLASLLRTETIALFGPETPALYGPLNEHATILYEKLACSPCFSPYNYRTSVCHDNKCMKSISAEAVYALVQKKLTELPAAITREDRSVGSFQ